MRFLNAHDQYLLQGSDLMIESNEEKTQSLNVYSIYLRKHFAFFFFVLESSAGQIRKRKVSKLQVVERSCKHFESFLELVRAVTVGGQKIPWVRNRLSKLSTHALTVVYCCFYCCNIF